MNFFISVGEPWDFNSPDGENIIKGTILKTVSDLMIIFKANYTLNFDNVSGDVLILFPRYYESDFRDFSKGKDFVTINGSVLLINYEESLTEATLKQHSKHVLSGSLREL